MVKKEFTATEVMALLEDLRSDFRVVTEAVMALKVRIENLEQKIEKLEAKVEKLDLRMTSIEYKVDGVYDIVAKNSEDIEMIKLELREINRKLSQKVDREELIVLEKRISVLEKKLSTRK